jgi:hypothetical protein
MPTRQETLYENKYRALADLFRDDANQDAMSLYYHKGIIDSDELKKNIQAAIEESEKRVPTYVKELREFLTFVIRTGERGPTDGWWEEKQNG